MGSIDRKLAILLVLLIAGVCYHLGRGSTTFTADGIDPDWDAAVNSRDATKPAVVFFTATWCPYCHQLSNDVLSRTEVQDYLYRHYNFHTVELTTRAGTARANQFHVHSFPTLIRYDSGGHETSRTHNGSNETIMAWLKAGEE